MTDKTDKTIASLRQEKKEIDKQIAELYCKNQDIVHQIELLERQQQTHFYTIRCTPSKNDHMSHTVGIFSTIMEASQWLPQKASSHDSDDNCTWYYTIEVVNAKSASNLFLLDKQPESFPY